MFEIKNIPFQVYNKKVLYNFFIKFTFEQGIMKSIQKWPKQLAKSSKLHV